MNELDEIRKKKLEELKKQQEEEEKKIQIELQKQAILKQILSPKARERLTRIKMANPQYAEQVEGLLIQLAQNGKIQRVLGEDDLVNLLRQISSKKKDFRIRRI